jgi:hypothetical protein
MVFPSAGVDHVAMRWWVVVFVMGCHSRNDVVPPRVVASASAAPLPSVTTTTPPVTPCSITASLEIAPKSVTSLENVRVVHASRTLVTWQDANKEPRMGDSSVAANVAWIDWAPSPHFATAELPYRAYASAEWSRIGPTRGAHGVELFTFGMAGSWSFGLYAQDESVWRKLDINADAPKAVTTLMVNMSVEEDFAVAEDAPVAAVAGYETPCPSWYACETVYQPAREKGFPASVRVVDLANARSTVVWKSNDVRSLVSSKHPTFAPAIAIGKTKGAVAFRSDQSIQLASLDASFRPSPPTSIANADVGAPAIAFDGDRPILAWAERASSNAPYHLVVWFDGAAHVVTTGTASAFAPALAARDGAIVLAWMEGDASKHGAVRAARLSLAGSWDASRAPTLSDADNARDPEISMQGDEAIVVWSDISHSSRIQVRKLSCPR